MTEYLGSTGELDNIYIMFCSDNDAEAVAYEAYARVSGALMEHLGKYYNTEPSNISDGRK